MATLNRKRLVPGRIRGLLIAVLMTASLAGLACNGDDGGPEKTVIRLHDFQSESQWVINGVAEFILEKGYGYGVESVSATTPQMQETLANGELELTLEGWQQNIIDWYDREVARGTVLNLGVMFEASSQVFVIPRWVAETYGIRTVLDMKEHWELFTDPQDSSKGVFYNCIAGWNCANINRAKLEGWSGPRWCSWP